MRINPFALRPVEEITETRTFTDPRHPDSPIELTFSVSPDDTFEWARIEKAEKYIAEYMDATGPLMPNKGRLPRMSKRLCFTIASLEMMHAPSEGRAYDFNIWAALYLTHKDAMRQIDAWAVELLTRAGQERGND